MLLWAAHYSLLGALAAGGGLHVLAATTMWLSHALSTRRRRLRVGLSVLLVAANLVLGVVLYLGPADLAMIAGNALFAFGRRLRVGYILATALIGVGAVLWGSLPGVVISVIMVGANALALARWQADSPVCADSPRQ